MVKYDDRTPVVAEHIANSRWEPETNYVPGEPVDPGRIANFFLKKGEYNNFVLGKLVYFVYGFCLAIQNREIFVEPIEAWKYGPVIPSLYHRFMEFGNGPIKQEFLFHSVSKNKFTAPQVREDDYELLDILEIVYEAYGSLSEDDFRRLTHHRNSPWQRAYKEYQKHVVIDKGDIKEHFRSLLPIFRLRSEVVKLLQEGSKLRGPFKNADELIESLDL